MPRNEEPGAEVDVAPPGPRDGIRILVVEDDPQVSEALGQCFELEEYDVRRAYDGATALELLRQPPGFDLVLLDVLLPRLNGFQVLRESQEMGIHTPMLMMSARGGQENILRGLGLGARDFVVKPFDPDDLLGRVRAILGRTQPPAGSVRQFRLGGLMVNLTTFEAFLDGELLKLTQMEFDLLRQLILNRGRILSRKRLLRDAWGIDQDVISLTISPDITGRRLEASIESLRSKIRSESNDEPLIETVYGLGYRLNA